VESVMICLYDGFCQLAKIFRLLQLIFQILKVLSFSYLIGSETSGRFLEADGTVFAVF
jgi:hypothetical protein